MPYPREQHLASREPPTAHPGVCVEFPAIEYGIATGDKSRARAPRCSGEDGEERR